jgi:hypothetical protein
MARTSPAHPTDLGPLTQPPVYAKLPKCKFEVSSVDYFGHIISSQGVQADPTKVQAIWFLGLLPKISLLYARS